MLPRVPRRGCTVAGGGEKGVSRGGDGPQSRRGTRFEPGLGPHRPLSPSPRIRLHPSSGPGAQRTFSLIFVPEISA